CCRQTVSEGAVDLRVALEENVALGRGKGKVNVVTEKGPAPVGYQIPPEGARRLARQEVNDLPLAFFLAVVAHPEDHAVLIPRKGIIGTVADSRHVDNVGLSGFRRDVVAAGPAAPATPRFGNLSFPVRGNPA